LADQGSRIAVSSAIQCLEKLLRENPVVAHGPANLDDYIETEVFRSHLQKALDAAYESVHKSSIALRCPIEDLNTTLIVAFATKHMVGAVHVGDGVSIIRDEMGNLRCLTTPQNGEFANETFSI